MSLLAMNFFTGLFNLVLLFCFCFAAAYIVKAVWLIYVNFKPAARTAKRPVKTAVEAEKPKEPEKIYYIVEKKRPAPKRKVTSEPKRIYFNDR